MNDIVAENQADAVIFDEFAADEKRLRQTIWSRLNKIGKPNAQIFSRTEEILEAGKIAWSRDNQNIALRVRSACTIACRSAFWAAIS